jgi:hypothetical protein
MNVINSVADKLLIAQPGASRSAETLDRDVVN